MAAPRTTTAARCSCSRPRALPPDGSACRSTRAAACDLPHLSFAGDTLLFQANELPLRYDLVTGSLSRLGAPGASSVLGLGRYVLWYDADGGHVAELAQ
ncbi:hypothetical protein [Nocardioides cynanchi]|uniref:hypothetical protein n=1 Tax=Nocardioides cynanchi TaxID=2558918 RepID=UPI00177B79E1|nr:hypothetical protein [Nocardioides cynanchi]